MPGFIRTKYLQYKRDTEKLASWLCDGAINYGFPASAFPKSARMPDDIGDGKTAQQVKNAKKNAKKKAKAKTSAAPKSIQDERGEVEGGVGQTPRIAVDDGYYQLSIPQFVETARFLVEKNAPIPTEIMQIIKRCIRIRMESARSFLSNPDVSTMRHQHFIQVLQEVGDIFQEHRAKLTDKGSKKSVVDLTNRFDVLAVEGGANVDNEEDLPDIFLPEPPNPPNAPKRSGKRVYIPAASIEDGIWDMLAFYRDVHIVREYLHELWESYKAGDIDILTAAVTSNTAMELLRPSHDDVVSNVLPIFNNNLALLLASLFYYVTGRLDPTSGLPRPIDFYNGIDDNDEHLTAAYDYLLIPPLQVLAGLGAVMKYDDIPVYKAGHYGIYDPAFGQKNLSFKKRCLQGQILLCETFSEYMSLLVVGETLISGISKQTYEDNGGAKREKNFFFLNEMAVEMDKYAKTKECSLLLVVYSQIFIDINGILGKEADRGLKDIRAELSIMKATMARRSRIEGPVKPYMLHPNMEKSLEALAAEMDFWLTTDPIELSRRGSQGTKAASEAGQSHLLERDPILCGLLLFRMKLRYQHLGFVLANCWSSILSVAHLYTACQHYRGLPGISAMDTWPDMELIMQMHGKQDMFGGKIPDTIDDSYISFLQMLGYSKEILATQRVLFTDNELPSWLKNRRERDIPKMAAKADPKGLKDHTQILPIFKKRYFDDLRSGVQLDINSIEHLISDIRAGASTGGRGKGKMRRERKHRSPKFSVIQILSVLEAGLTDETHSIRFDYISMHLRCLRILQHVRDASHAYLSGKLGPGYLQDDSQVAYIVALVLHFATMSGRAAAAIGIKRQGKGAVMVGSKLLMGANNAMKECISDPREARAELDKLKR